MSSSRVGLLAGLCLAFAASGAGCVQAPPTPAPPRLEPVPETRFPDPVPPAPSSTKPIALDRSLLRNAEYDFGEDLGRVRLRDGSAALPLPLPGEDGQARLDETSAFADLDGDGREDAIVGIRVSMGGSGSWLYVFTVLGREASVVATRERNVFLDDRDGIRAIRSLSGARFAFDLVVHAPDDPACCPSQLVTRTYRYEAGHLVEAPE